MSLNQNRFMRHVGALMLLGALLGGAFSQLAGAVDYTATGVVISGQAGSLIFTNQVGQVLFRGNMHTAQVTSPDPRMTGRRRITVDGFYNADGTADIWGTSYHEVGTWNGLEFTPTGAFWDLRYSGRMGVDNSLQLHLVGHGEGASIGGWHLDETLVRGPAPSPDDATVPYQYSGRIDPPPSYTRALYDDFSGPALQWIPMGTGQGNLSVVDGKLEVHGSWPGTVTHWHGHSYFWGYRQHPWSVANGHTIEFRADLVSVTGGATNAAAILLGRDSDAHFYVFFKGSHYLELAKYQGGGVLSVLFHERLTTRNENVVLSLALTRSGSNLILTARVFAPSPANAVLFQRSVIDSPKADPTISRTEYGMVSGMNLDVVPEFEFAPIFSGDRLLLECWQYTDGTQPSVDVVFDNAELRLYDTPQIAMNSSVTLWVPENFAAEHAHSLEGPWAPVSETAFPGLKRLSVPTQDPAAFFRAVPAP